MSKKENLLRFWESMERRERQDKRDVVTPQKVKEMVKEKVKEKVKETREMVREGGETLPSLERSEILVTTTKTRVRREKKTQPTQRRVEGSKESQLSPYLTPPAASEFSER